MVAISEDTLLQPISPEQPCGDDLEYDPQFVALEALSQGKAEQQIGDAVIEAEEADWAQVKKQSLELLERTKDIRILAYLARAVLDTDDLTACAGVITTLKQLVCDYWPTIHPQLDEDDGDPTMRINALLALCDESTFLLPLKKAPLVSSRMLGSFSLRDISYTNGESSPPEGYEVAAKSTIDGAFQDADLELLSECAQSIRQAGEDVKALEQFVTEQVGVANAASFAPLVEVLQAISQTMQIHLPQADSSSANPAEQGQTFGEQSADVQGSTLATDTNPGTVVTGSSPAGLSGGIANRDQVIQALDSIEEYYTRYEPTSPVPLLLARARRLVNMDFMQIMSNIAPDALSQVEMIRGPEPQEDEDSQDTDSSTSNNDDW